MGCASVGSNRRFDNCCLRSFSGNEIWSHVGQTNLGDASLFVQLNNSVRFSTHRFISACWYTLYTYATETVAYLIASTPLLNIEAKTGVSPRIRFAPTLLVLVENPQMPPSLNGKRSDADPTFRNQCCWFHWNAVFVKSL